MSPLAAANEFVRLVRWTGTFASGGTHAYVRYNGPVHIPFESVLSSGGFGSSHPNLTCCSLDSHESATQTASRSSRTFFAQLTRVPNTQTHRPRYMRHP